MKAWRGARQSRRRQHTRRLALAHRVASINQVAGAGKSRRLTQKWPMKAEQLAASGLLIGNLARAAGVIKQAAAAIVARREASPRLEAVKMASAHRPLYGVSEA